MKGPKRTGARQRRAHVLTTAPFTAACKVIGATTPSSFSAQTKLTVCHRPWRIAARSRSPGRSRQKILADFGTDPDLIHEEQT